MMGSAVAVQVALDREWGEIKYAVEKHRFLLVD